MLQNWSLRPGLKQRTEVTEFVAYQAASSSCLGCTWTWVGRSWRDGGSWATQSTTRLLRQRWCTSPATPAPNKQAAESITLVYPTCCYTAQFSAANNTAQCTKYGNMAQLPCYPSIRMKTWRSKITSCKMLFAIKLITTFEDKTRENAYQTE